MKRMCDRTSWDLNLPATFPDNPATSIFKFTPDVDKEIDDAARLVTAWIYLTNALRHP